MENNTLSNLDKQTLEFETLCGQLRRNVATAEYIKGEVMIHSDARAVRLAESLEGNTNLLFLCIDISPENITCRSAQALGRGVQRSAVQKLYLDNDYGNPFAVTDDRMWCFLAEAIQNLRELIIFYKLDDMEAVGLGAWLCDNRRLEQLSLQLEDVTEEGALELAKGIQRSAISNLELIDVSPEVCRVLLASGILTSLPTLRHIKINNEPIFEDVSVPEDWSAFGSLTLNQDPTITCLRQPSQLFETIELNWCFLNDADVKILARSLMHDNPHLKQLILHCSNITDNGITFLAEGCKACLQLEHLDLSKNGIGVAGLCRLLEASSTHANWNSLNVSSNPNIGRQGIGNTSVIDPGMTFQLPRIFCLDSCHLALMDVTVLLSSERFCTKKLRSLDLGRNHLGDDFAFTLADWLNKGLLLSLEEIDLSGNEISVNGVQQLLRVTASTHPCLKVLDVSGTNIGFQGLAMIANDLSSSKLSKLCISVERDTHTGTATTSSSDGAAARRAAENAAAEALFVKAVRANMHLQQLDLWRMDLSEQSKTEIKFFLDLDKSGRPLLRLEDGLQPFGLWCHVLARCGNNKSVLFYLLAEQPMLIPSFQSKALSEEEGSTNTKVNRTRKRPAANAKASYNRSHLGRKCRQR